jgi:hypothetical protein
MGIDMVGYNGSHTYGNPFSIGLYQSWNVVKFIKRGIPSKIIFYMYAYMYVRGCLKLKCGP